MKPIAPLLLIFFIFNPTVILAESNEPELIDAPEDTVEVIPWDFAPGEEMYEEEDDDEEDKYERPTQEYNVNININENQQPYYWGPYYPVGRRHHDIVNDDFRPPRKPAKTQTWGRPWMPAGKPTRR